MLDHNDLRNIYERDIRREQMINKYINKKHTINSNSIVQVNKNLIKFHFKPIIEDGVRGSSRI